MSESARVARPRGIEANLPGPSRRITVEPIQVPTAPEHEPAPAPAPVEEPVRAPEREPAPVR
jgi:hypothetical protein